MYGAAETFDLLLDCVHDAGGPPPRYGRVNGEHAVWLNVTLPTGKTVEQRADSLDTAARAILDLEYTASDRERDKALKATHGS